MKIEIDKEDFVKLAVYASCADLPDEEREYEKTVSGILHSLDKDVAAEIAGEMLALKVKIELLNGANVEDGGDDETETSSKKHKVEKIMTDIVRKINTRLEQGETITEIVGAYYNYNNLVDLLCGIYDLTFEERQEVMKQWSFDVMFND